MNKEKRQSIADRLARITKNNRGRLTPEAVVDDARNPKSPLHDQFEWDESKAAAKHWLNQARQLIRSIKVEVETTTTIVSAVNYVRDPTAEAQGYVDVMALKDDKFLAREALVSELSRARSLLERAESLALVLDLSPELDDLKDRVEKLRNRVDLAA